MRKNSSSVYETRSNAPSSPPSRKMCRAYTTKSVSDLPDVPKQCIVPDKSIFPTEGLPLKPAVVRQKYSSQLTVYEQREIMKYPEIYYIGVFSKKLKANLSANNNYGFDSPTANYRAFIGDHIKYRYEIKSILGHGVFGQVLKCYDHKTKENVAVKIIINTNQMNEQGKVEASTLLKLTNEDHQNRSCCMHVFETFNFRNHICITYEILGRSLFDFHKSINFKPYPMDILKPVVKDILTGLLFIHLHQFVHCDLKPENILFVPQSINHVKLIDFGSSCVAGKPVFNYIQSRFYRAPEIILGLKYGTSVDLWSLGCIIAELLAGKPIFQGRNEFEQMHFYSQILGQVPVNMIKQSPRRVKYFREDNTLIPSKTLKLAIPNGRNKLQVMTNTNDPQLLDLLEKLLTFDPTKRLSASQALSHPWFNPPPMRVTRTASTKSRRYIPPRPNY